MMTKDQEQVLCNAVSELIKFTWDILYGTIGGVTNDVDELRARTLGKELSLLVDSYENNNETCLPETTLWLAKEVIQAVEDILQPRRPFRYHRPLTFK